MNSQDIPNGWILLEQFFNFQNLILTLDYRSLTDLSDITWYEYQGAIGVTWYEYQRAILDLT